MKSPREVSVPNETFTLSIVRDRILAVPNVILRISPARGSSFDVPLGLRPLTIGRDLTCDIAIDDHGISQRHCEIALTMRGVEITDLESKNGLYLHSTRILQAILPLNVPIQMGNSQLLVTSGGTSSEIPISANQRIGQVIGKSAIMRATFQQLERAAQSDAHVVFWGEPGTGKRTLAECLHSLSFGHLDHFYVFDAKQEDPATLESAFQQTIGSFTAGSLFIHEPAALPRELQLRLAMMLGRWGNRGRLILGMTQDPSVAVKHGWLAGEIFAPGVSFLNLPVFPLRQRRDDIPALVEFFLIKHGPIPMRDLPRETLQLLERHSWPGNVGQLEDMVADIAQKAHLGEKLLKSLMRANTDDSEQSLAGSLKEAREEIVRTFEKTFIEAALRKHKGNVTHTAKALGISRQMLHRLMVQHGVQNLK